MRSRRCSVLQAALSVRAGSCVARISLRTLLPRRSLCTNQGPKQEARRLEIAWGVITASGVVAIPLVLVGMSTGILPRLPTPQFSQEARAYIHGVYSTAVGCSLVLVGAALSTTQLLRFNAVQKLLTGGLRLVPAFGAAAAFVTYCMAPNDASLIPLTTCAALSGIAVAPHCFNWASAPFTPMPLRFLLQALATFLANAAIMAAAPSCEREFLPFKTFMQRAQVLGLYRQFFRTTAPLQDAAADIRRTVRAQFRAHQQEQDAGHIRTLIVQGSRQLDQVKVLVSTACPLPPMAASSIISDSNIARSTAGSSFVPAAAAVDPVGINPLLLRKSRGAPAPSAVPGLIGEDVGVGAGWPWERKSTHKLGDNS